MGARLGGAARAIGDGDEARRQRLQPPDAGPELGLQRLGLRREEFEGELGGPAARRGAAGRRSGGRSASAAACRREPGDGEAWSMRGRLPCPASRSQVLRCDTVWGVTGYAASGGIAGGLQVTGPAEAWSRPCRACHFRRDHPAGRQRATRPMRQPITAFPFRGRCTALAMPPAGRGPAAGRLRHPARRPPTPRRWPSSSRPTTRPSPQPQALCGAPGRSTKTVLRPVAVGYRDVVPAPVRTGVRNLLGNLRTPVILVNDMLQGEPRRAGDTLGRFVINSTLGFGGIFDVAASRLRRPRPFRGLSARPWPGLGRRRGALPVRARSSARPTRVTCWASASASPPTRSPGSARAPRSAR